MKKIVTLSFFLIFAIGTAQEKNTATITINISNISNDKGVLMVGLYNSETTWLKKLYSGVASEIKDKKATATFNHIPKGTYAIAVYHDENKDGKLNMFLGVIPKEDNGASNNASSTFGPPKWTAAKFNVDEEINNQSIKL